MTLFSMANQQFTAIQLAELALRIVIATICGGAIGAERSRRFKEAGVRTHSMVACTAALAMVVSKYSFADLVSPDGMYLLGTRGADSARIAAQVISGISFLGVGIIYRDSKFTTKGLTTAACIWMVAVIGLTIGAGMYQIGLFATVFVLVIQLLTHRFEIGNDRYSSVELDLLVENNDETQKKISEALNSWQAIVVKSEVSKDEHNMVHYSMTLRMKDRIGQEKLTAFLSSNSMIHWFRVKIDN